mmetsp:Transcript_7407/g.27898  ORF Transcript_7407/g.27898 Transcript_7407/m.27898 type:complete len:211 (-) Transcript_7407:390-1022(-)
MNVWKSVREESLAGFYTKTNRKSPPNRRSSFSLISEVPTRPSASCYPDHGARLRDSGVTSNLLRSSNLVIIAWLWRVRCGKEEAERFFGVSFVRSVPVITTARRTSRVRTTPHVSTCCLSLHFRVNHLESLGVHLREVLHCVLQRVGARHVHGLLRLHGALHHGVVRFQRVRVVSRSGEGFGFHSLAQAVLRDLGDDPAAVLFLGHDPPS